MSLSRDIASKRFPLSARSRRIYGEGFFALVSRCNLRAWTVHLFPTVEARREKIEQWELSYAGCRAVRGCTQTHETIDLRPVAREPQRDHTEQFNFFNIAMKPMCEKTARS